jgi:hypothetical protein
MFIGMFPIHGLNIWVNNVWMIHKIIAEAELEKVKWDAQNRRAKSVEGRAAYGACKVVIHSWRSWCLNFLWLYIYMYRYMDIPWYTYDTDPIWASMICYNSFHEVGGAPPWDPSEVWVKSPIPTWTQKWLVFQLWKAPERLSHSYRHEYWPI